MQLAGRVHFNCTAIKVGAAISATGKIDTLNASLEIDSKDDAMVLFSGNDSVLVNDLDCLNSPGCKVSGVTEEVRNLTCPRAQGVRKRADGLQCATCPSKHTRLAAEATCRRCPSLASLGCCKVHHVSRNRSLHEPNRLKNACSRSRKPRCSPLIPIGLLYMPFWEVLTHSR